MRRLLRLLWRLWFYVYWIAYALNKIGEAVQAAILTYNALTGRKGADNGPSSKPNGDD